MQLSKKKNKSLNEFCNHCGRSVRFKSGLFINRIPDFNDIETRKINGLRFPIGDFICIDCDEKRNEIYLELYF